MAQTCGIEAPRPGKASKAPPARVFLASRERVAEFDASAPEVRTLDV